MPTAPDPLAPDPVRGQSARARQDPPSWTDHTAARAAEAMGGPWGRRAVALPGSFWTPLRVVLALAAFTLLLGFAQKFPCADGQWNGNKQYTHACYSDILPLWFTEGLNDGKVPYRDHPVEYPVLTGGYMWGAAELTRAWVLLDPSANQVQAYWTISSAGLALLAMLMVSAVVRTSGYRPYDGAIAAFSPLLVFHAFSHWDLLAMMFAATAMWAWAKRNPALAGVLIGLGTAAKLYPALLLIPLAVLGIRTRRFGGPLLAGLSAAAAWLAVNLPVAIPWPDNWLVFFRLNQQREAERSTIWNIVAYIRANGLHPGPVQDVAPNTAVAITVLAGMAVVIGIGLGAPTKPRLAQLAFLTVVAFLLTTKVWSPQYSLWLVPLLALARPRWRSAIIWQCAEIAVWYLTLLNLIPAKDYGIDYPPLLGVLLIRDAILLVICGMIVREMWRPELDVVRTDGSGAVLRDDPGGGIFDAAPDHPPLPRAHRPAAPAQPTESTRPPAPA
ncbi:MAG: glycosyltransferase 87 family protein [Frankiaceae bacterium]|jgi:uncharacterized membrane protein|nr:glycosyltransferase 87 family protein [Frankiaceae bacterium]